MKLPRTILRLTRLIDDILDIAKMELCKLEWQMRVLDPKTVIEEALAVTAGLIHQDRNVKLQAENSDELTAVHVDSDRLTQVLINFISNAVKFCDPENGSVWVTARADAGALQVSVRDNGIGIAPEDHDKVFERFQQVGNPMTDKPKCTGLGLPICVEIIHQFGGEIWVDSKLGEGATFVIRIPTALNSDGHHLEQ